MYAEREATRESSRRAMDQLYYELIHNLVVELTRTGIEVKNLKMRVESLSGRLEFNERRARALESAVVYRPSSDERPIRPPQQQPPPPPAPMPQVQTPQTQAPVPQAAQTPGGVRGRRPWPAQPPAPSAARASRRWRGRRPVRVGLGSTRRRCFGGITSLAAHTEDAASAGQAGKGRTRVRAARLDSEDLGHLADDGGPTEPGSGSDPDAQ